MYQFESAEHEAAFRAALDTGEVQHIRGEITDVSGMPLYVDENTIIDTPAIDVRCLEDEDVFNIAEIYVGELNLRIKNDNIRAQLLIGGEVRLYTYVIDNNIGSIEVPLGVWDIVDAKRESTHFIDIVGHDHMARLSVPTGDDSIGYIPFGNLLRQIEMSAGIEFAQEPEEIIDLFAPKGDHIFITGACTHFEETCWEEIKYIAQIIGGFAYANRYGKIEFRRFSQGPCMSIDADRRFHCELKEGSFGVRGITYTDSTGKTYTAYSTVMHNSSSILVIPNSKYIWGPSSKTFEEEYYNSVASGILGKVAYMNVVPGSVEFYGDPTLDLGDMVKLEGGIGGQDVDFLVTGIYWQFRGPMTITSGGVPKIGEYVSGTAGGGSGASPVPSSTVITKSINTAELSTYIGAVFPTERSAARTRFSCKESTNAFLECTMTVIGTGAGSKLEASVYLDSERQAISPQSSIYKGRYTTIAFSVDMAVQSGMHDVIVTVAGTSELIEVNGCVWGQNIRAEEIEYTNDYDYAITEGKAEITGYDGEDLHIEIPDKLGGAGVTAIGGESFTESNVETVYIPNGITEIRDGSTDLIKELLENLPIEFSAAGTELIDWRIKGAAGGVGCVGTNKLNYKPIARGSGPGGTYTDYGTIAGVAMNAVSIPDGAPADSDHQCWYMLRANINEGGNWVDDYRSPTYANCNWYAKLTAGTYKLVAECANPYGITVRVPNLDSIYRNDSALPGNHIPRYDLVDSSGNILIEVTWENFFGSGNQRRWTRKESVFTVTEDTDVGVFSKMFQYDSSYAVDNITPYLVFRYMIVPADTPTSQFSVTLPISGSPVISGESCWEPYKITLPLTVRCGERSAAVAIDLGKNLLGENDTVSFSSTHTTIPTFKGTNIITAETDIQPSEMYIKYNGKTGAFMNAADLEYVSIPESVKLIGENAFTNTALKSVRISRDCVFYPTSFPEDCQISYYDEEIVPDEYYTADQVDRLVDDIKLKQMRTWSGIRSYRWSEVKKYKWEEVKNGRKNN